MMLRKGTKAAVVTFQDGQPLSVVNTTRAAFPVQKLLAAWRKYVQTRGRVVRALAGTALVTSTGLALGVGAKKYRKQSAEIEEKEDVGTKGQQEKGDLGNLGTGETG